MRHRKERKTSDPRLCRLLSLLLPLPLPLPTPLPLRPTNLTGGNILVFLQPGVVPLTVPRRRVRRPEVPPSARGVPPPNRESAAV